MNKLRWFCLILVLLILTGTAAAGSQFMLEIPDQVIISGTKIYLRDLGVITGGTAEQRLIIGQIDLGAAPPPGQTRVFSRDYLNLILQQQRIKDSLQLTMGKQVEVRSEASCITGKQIEEAVLQTLPPVPAGINRRWVEFRNVPEATWLAKGEWTISVSPIGKVPLVGPVVFKVVINKGPDYKVINLSGKIRAIARVWRSTKELKAHNDLEQSEFEPVEMELSNGKEFTGIIPLNYRIVRRINPGDLLEADQIEPVPLVKKDHQVRVNLKSVNIEVVIDAIALADGWHGDQIKLKNPDSKKIFYGRVTGGNTAEVEWK